jgi:hypothetical protein
MHSVERQPTFWRNTPPLFSGLKSKVSKKPAGSNARPILRRYVPLNGLNGIIFQKAELNTSDIDCRVNAVVIEVRCKRMRYFVSVTQLGISNLCDNFICLKS